MAVLSLCNRSLLIKGVGHWGRTRNRCVNVELWRTQWRGGVIKG